MTNICKFEEDTKNYLARFYEILEEMIQGMEGAELSDSLSHNFIVQMIPHHMAAIEMSKNLLKYNPCAPLRIMAENIVSMQARGIEEMKEALEPCCKLINSNQDLCLYQHRFRQITRNMHIEMNNACSDNNISANFMREMIPIIRAPSIWRKMPCDTASAPGCSPCWKRSLSPRGGRYGK